MNDEMILLREPGAEQKRVLDQYRLTEMFRDAFGNHILNHFPKSGMVQEAVKILKRFKKIDEVNIEQWRDLLIDMLYSRYVFNFLYREYFLYELTNKSITERLEFMASLNCGAYRKTLITNNEDVKKLDDKYLSYQLLKPYYKRDMCNLCSKNQKDEFLEFCRQHKRFMIKPVGSFQGNGIKIINCEDYNNPEELLDILLENGEQSPLLKKGDISSKVLCEELVVCEDSIRSIHPSSVNTVRIYTYMKLNGEPTLVMSFIKAGQSGAVIDNVGPGGMLAAIDVENGIICTDAVDELGNKFPTHPDTGFVLKDFHIPQWEELKKMMLEVAPKFPGVSLIGWDVALSKDRGWQIIEGNVRGDISVNQIAIKTGLRRQLETAIEWDIRRKKLAEKP